MDVLESSVVCREVAVSDSESAVGTIGIGAVHCGREKEEKVGQKAAAHDDLSGGWVEMKADGRWKEEVVN